MFLNESSQHFLLFLTKERVSYFLSRFSEKESMAKKEGARGIPISPGPLKAAKTSPFGLFLDLFPAAYFFRTILRISRAGGGGGAKKGTPEGAPSFALSFSEEISN